ncbi:MAG TPA: hypothetical protein VGL07_13300 [Buttiauxella sp.]|jgi:hypothetical protein
MLNVRSYSFSPLSSSSSSSSSHLQSGSGTDLATRILADTTAADSRLRIIDATNNGNLSQIIKISSVGERQTTGATHVEISGSEALNAVRSPGTPMTSEDRAAIVALISKQYKGDIENYDIDWFPTKTETYSGKTTDIYFKLTRKKSVSVECAPILRANIDLKDLGSSQINQLYLSLGINEGLDRKILDTLSTLEKVKKQLGAEVLDKSREINTLTTQNRDLADQIKALEVKTNNLEKDIQELSGDLADKDGTITSKEEEIAEIKAKLSELNGEKEGLESTIAKYAGQREQLENEIVKLTENEKNLRQAMESAKGAANTIANDATRSKKWALLIGALTATILAIVTGVGAVAKNRAENEKETADADISNGQQNVSDATAGVEKAKADLTAAENADYSPAGETAGNAAIATQVEKDREAYIAALGNGDEAAAAEIAERYVALNGGSPDFNAAGLSPAGEEYMQEHYDNAYASAVKEAKEEAVENAQNILTQANNTKSQADVALSNARSRKEGAEKLSSNATAGLAAGIPIVLLAGGGLAAANLLHVHKKNRVIKENIGKIERNNYDQVKSTRGSGLESLFMRSKQA